MKDARLADLAIFIMFFFSLKDGKRLWQSLTLILLPHIFFSSCQMWFSSLLPRGTIQGTLTKIQGTREPSHDLKSPRPTELHQLPAVTIPHSALYVGGLQWPDHLLSGPKHITPIHTTASPAGQSQTSCQERTELFLFFFPDLTVVQQKQCEDTWVGQCEFAWLLLENYPYIVN